MPLFAEVADGKVRNIHKFAFKPEVDESVLQLIEVAADAVPPIDTEYMDGRFVLPEVTMYDKLSIIRNERNHRINAIAWVLSRHRDEKELQDLGVLEELTSLSEKQYHDVLEYVHKLRTLTETLDLSSPWLGLANIPWPALNINVVVKIFGNTATEVFAGSISDTLD